MGLLNNFMMSAVISVIILISALSVDDVLCQIKIKAVGDVMPGSITPKKILPPDNGKFFIDSIGQYLSDAEIIFGNLEGSFILDGMKADKCSDESREKGICYEFGTPAEIAPVLKELGFTVMSRDNNHSEDYGEEGFKFTSFLLDELGIQSAMKRNFAEIKIHHQKIALVAFGYSENSYNISDLKTADSVISILDKNYELIIVSFHGGAEGRRFQKVTGETEIFLGENRGNVSAFAKCVIDAGADLVLGHGPHVLRGIELYKNKLIAYSLGNFLTYGNMNIRDENGISAILEVRIDTSSGDFLRGKIIPVKQIGSGYPVYDVNLSSISMIKKLSNEDFPDSNLEFLLSGSFYSNDIAASPLPFQFPEPRKFIMREVTYKTLNELNTDK
ncbi:MAG: CapA family protein [Ignavibacteriales bacterium]|nr:MAG: CapA family protein [Ignavibacteriales bacterium]